QFNGTAGIWRKEAILNAGGWKDDTITEDLDLSYRAQLHGYKVVFLEDVDTPAELPISINDFKSQQYRWSKGAAQTARKLIGEVLRAKQLSLFVRYHAAFHLFSSLLFLTCLLQTLLLVAIESLCVEPTILILTNIINAILMFITSYIGNSEAKRLTLNDNSHRQLDKKNNNNEHFLLKLVKFLFHFLLFISLIQAICLHNTIAVIDGLIRKKGEFKRTPKYSVETTKYQSKKSINDKKIHYQRKSIDWFALADITLAIVFILKTLHCIFFVGIWVKFGTIVLYSSLAVGYCVVSVASLLEVYTSK
ncbi:unnamed protein product, partial [Didymodactylos carnosus]